MPEVLNMKRGVYGLFVCVLLCSACADPAPYRAGKLDEDTSCAGIYAKGNPPKPLSSATDAEQTCWKRRIEEHANYDLLFAEFTDQGWIDGSSDLKRPAR